MILSFNRSRKIRYFLKIVTFYLLNGLLVFEDHVCVIKYLIKDPVVYLLSSMSTYKNFSEIYVIKHNRNIILYLQYLTPVITKIVNQSLDTGICPQE